MPQPITLSAFKMARLGMPMSHRIAAAAAPAGDAVMAPAIAALSPAAMVAAAAAPAATPAAPGIAAAAAQFSPVMLEMRLNPALFELAAAATPAPSGYSREAATRPIAEATAVFENSLFVSPDGATTYYLPRYRLKTLGGARYDIAVTAADDGSYRLAAGFERLAPEGAAVPAGAVELPHDAVVWLSFTDAKGLLRQLPFDELQFDPPGTLVGAAARMDLETRDAGVMAVQRNGARLTIRRTVHVTAQLPPADGNTVVVDHRLAKVRRLPFARRAALAADAGGIARRAAFAHRFDAQLSPGIGELVGGAATPAPAPAPRYHDVDQAFEQPVAPDPLLLDAQLHPYFTAGIGGPVADHTTPLRRIALAFADGGQPRQYPYYQDSDDPALFYFLPDSFRLGRANRTPFVPEMVVQMTAPDQRSDTAQAMIDYVARPWVVPERLAAAREALKAELPAAQADATPRLVPMPAQARLRMNLPGGRGAELREFADVTIDIANGFRQTLTVTLPEFRQLFAAAFSDTVASLFSGEVLVDARLPSPELVPVDIRFAHCVGPVMDTVETPGADGTIAVRLRNGTESPLRLASLPVQVAGGGTVVAGSVTGLDFASPVEIAPGQAIDFTVTPASPLPEGAVGDVIFDERAIDVAVSPEAVLPAISDASVPAEYERPIRVMALPAAFAADAPGGAIALIHVEFATGDSVDLTPEAHDTTADIRLPLANLLVNQDVRATYRFRQQIVFQSGEQQQDADWREADSDLLVVPIRGGTS